MAIGSNDIPDFAIVDATMMASLIKNDMVEDMTDVYETWATDDLKQLTEQNVKDCLLQLQILMEDIWEFLFLIRLVIVIQ